MSEKGGKSRGPAKLDSLDGVFAPKGAAVPPPQAAGPLPSAAPEVNGEDGFTSSTIRIPHYLTARISEHLHVHRGDTLTTLVFKGLTKLGIEVRPEDLVPKRQRRMR